MSQPDPDFHHIPSEAGLSDVPGTPTMIDPLSVADARAVRGAARREARRIVNGDATLSALLIGALGYVGVSMTTADYVLGLAGLAIGLVSYAQTVLAQSRAAHRVADDAEVQVLGPAGLADENH